MAARDDSFERLTRGAGVASEQGLYARPGERSGVKGWRVLEHGSNFTVKDRLAATLPSGRSAARAARRISNQIDDDLSLSQIGFGGNNLVRKVCVPARRGFCEVAGFRGRNGPFVRNHSASNAMKAILMLSLLSLLSLSSLAWADDDALLRCRDVTEASARLACYDALVVPTREEKARQVVATQREQFGLVKADKTAPEAIESTIPGHFSGWEPGASIKLANGQVWQVNDNSRGIHNIDNPKVAIRHGMFSAYYLEIEGTNRSPRVNRVQ